MTKPATRKAKAASLIKCPCFMCKPGVWAAMPEKYIEYCHESREFNAWYKGEYINSFRSYLAADNALNEHKYELLNAGLIPTQHETQMGQEDLLAA